MNRLFIIVFLLAFRVLNAQIILTTSVETNLRKEADLNSSKLAELPAHKNVELLDFIPEGQFNGYFKVYVYGIVGYIHINHVNFDDSYFIAKKVEDSNVHSLYKEHKTELDQINNRKIYEEELWAKQNYKSTGSGSIYQYLPSKESSTNESIAEIDNTNVVKVINLYKMPSGTFEIPCKINGLALNFILDTGASDVSISMTEALFMLKNGYLHEEDILGSVNYRIASGEISEGTKIIIRKIEFEGLTLFNIEASVVHELQAPLLLGQSVLKELGKFQIDYNNNTLTILK